MIDLRTGHPRRLPHRALASACRGAAARLDTASEDSFPLQYEPSCFGTPRFVHALAQFLSEAHGVRIFENNLMATNGVSHGVDLCVSAMSTPGDLVLVEEPTYFLVRQIFLDHNLEVHGVRGDADGLDTAELERLLASGEMRPPRLVYVVPSHGNPSGISLSPSRRAHLVRLALRYDFLILSDDVYELLGWAEPTPRLIEYDPKYKQQLAAAGAEPSLSSAPSEPADVYAYPAAAQPKQHEVDVGVVVSIGSFTKILAPGLRLGWLEASPALLQQIRARGWEDSLPPPPPKHQTVGRRFLLQPAHQLLAAPHPPDCLRAAGMSFLAAAWPRSPARLLRSCWLMGSRCGTSASFVKTSRRVALHSATSCRLRGVSSSRVLRVATSAGSGCLTPSKLQPCGRRQSKEAWFSCRGRSAHPLQIRSRTKVT